MSTNYHLIDSLVSQRRDYLMDEFRGTRFSRRLGRKDAGSVNVGPAAVRLTLIKSPTAAPGHAPPRVA